MPVPDFQSFFKPLLDVAVDGKEHSMKEAREIIAKRMKISEDDLRELLPSGTQMKFDNRIAWAKSYFVQANVLESPRRGWFRIAERGKELHKKGHDRIDVKILNQFPEFVEYAYPVELTKGKFRLYAFKLLLSILNLLRLHVRFSEHFYVTGQCFTIKR